MPVSRNATITPWPPEPVDAVEQIGNAADHLDALAKRGVAQLERCRPAEQVIALDAVVDAVRVLIPDERLRGERAGRREHARERAREHQQAWRASWATSRAHTMARRRLRGWSHRLRGSRGGLER